MSDHSSDPDPDDADPPPEAAIPDIHLGAERKLYGRRRSHKLRTNRQSLMATLLEDLSALSEGAETVDLAALFGDRSAEVWLEIGFGGGEHLVHQARRHPEIGMIGCEHYLDGVAKLLSEIEREALDNIRIHAHDARDLMDALPDAALGRAFLLYPDPWPKTRHHKRRFMNPTNLDALARVMRPGAELRVASDIPDYIRHSLAAALDHPAFEWTAERASDWLEPWEDWPSTRYEAKALREGRAPAYLTFRRR